MTTLNTSQRLCDICRKIDFDAFLPSAHLEFPDATGSYSEPKEEAFDNGFTSPYLRQTNGTLHKVESGDFTRINQAFGTLEEIALRSKTCLLCNFVATTLKKTASVVGHHRTAHCRQWPRSLHRIIFQVRIQDRMELNGNDLYL
jgi:hypothetical protein